MLSLGLIVASHQRLRCTFSPDSRCAKNHVGHVKRLGRDLGTSAGGIMTWVVIAPTRGNAGVNALGVAGLTLRAVH
jgi:hypothetical protein